MTTSIQDTDKTCQICGKGTVTSHVNTTLYKYKGRAAMLPLHFLQCDTCYSDYAGEEESKANKGAVLIFRRMVDDLSNNEST